MIISLLPPNGLILDLVVHFFTVTHGGCLLYIFRNFLPVGIAIGFYRASGFSVESTEYIMKDFLNNFDGTFEFLCTTNNLCIIL